MQLSLDEDTQAKVLVRLLVTKGIDVETVYDAGLAGKPDAEVLAYARVHSRVVLTRNANDFKALHDADSQHPGILVEHQDADPAKNMSYEEIAEAIDKIIASGWDIQGQYVSINLWR
jgi:hypothetical protein